MIQQHYKGKDGALLVYDIANGDSLDALEYWINEMKKFSPDDIQKMII